MKAAMLLAVLLLAEAAFAAGASPKWTWEAGKQTNNGSITIKSTDGSTTYTGTQNPTASSVKVNKNVATQPPTVIIPPGGINRWSLYWADRTVGVYQ